MMELVENAPLREAFLRSPISPNALAAAVGKMRTVHVNRTLASGGQRRYRYRRGDGTAAKRDLGLVPNHHGGRGTGGLRRQIGAEKARRYAAALGVPMTDLERRRYPRPVEPA
jgi:hypothetical protein